MFDRIMENSMPMWMLVSALFPVFLFGTIIKAVLHFRKMRALEMPMRPVHPGEIFAVPIARPITHRERAESDDWIPSR